MSEHIQYVGAYKYLDPGFHRGDSSNSKFFNSSRPGEGAVYLWENLAGDKRCGTMGTDDIRNYNVTERLRDQRTVTIRAIRPDDKGLIIEGLNNVSADSLYRRFMAIRKEITAEGLKKVTEVDFVNVVALVAILGKDGNDQIAGGGRYVRTTGQRAEVAFLIGDTFQGLGIASLLFKHLAAIARDSGITQFEAEVLPSNEAMFKVFARSGIPITRKAAGGSVHVLMELTRQEEK